ncbi:MAG TPA: hypothetical protein VMU15_09280 [Anaeromyxobacter sp.]|nr:hypothetical protein [Anaeromyxobacter sp.]
MACLTRLASASLALLLACAACRGGIPRVVTVVRVLEPHSRVERVVTDGAII